jgi:AraC-like DNA-binding protein
MGAASQRCANSACRLQSAQAYIAANLEWGSLTPARTARALGISVRQLHLLFEPTGVTFSRYVLARRLERARSQLAIQPTRKIVDVALSSGIESLTVFYRGFREAFGMTPTHYRRSLCAERSAFTAQSPARADTVPGSAGLDRATA